MNSIGAFRSQAACASALVIALASLAAQRGAAECVENLTPQQRLAQFKQFDQRAEAAMHTRHFADAVHLYEQAVCLVPDSARAWYGLAMAQAASNNFAGGRESFQTADRLQPGSPMPLAMQVRMNFALHDTDALKGNLRTLAERFPQDAQTHQNLARYLAEQNLFELALAEALRAEEASSGDPAAMLELAGLESTAGAYGDAIRNALAVKDAASTLRGLRAAAAGIAGLSYESLGKSGEAVRLLRESIDLDPARENSYLALADLYDQMHRYPEAIDVLTRAKANIPDSRTLLLPLGLALVHAERYREGIATLKQAPPSEQVFIGLADAARRTGDAAAEIQALEQLETRQPEYPMIHILLARALLNESFPDYAKVLHELALAEKESPADADVFYLRSRVRTAQNRPNEAVANLRRAIELRPLEPSPYYQLARVYQKLGKSDLAREQFERFRYLQQPARR